MKRLFVLVLSALLTISLCAVFASAAETNVAAGKTYTYTGAYTDPSSGQVSWPDTDNKELTDGIFASKDTDVSYGLAMWVGMNQNGAGVVPNSGTVEIVVDLGSTVSGITKFTMNTLQMGGPAIGAPKEVKVSVSTDNQNFTNVGNMTITKTIAKPGEGDKGKDDGIYDCTLSSTEKSARYVKFTAKLSSAWLFVSEVGVYTGAPAASKDPINSSEATSSKAESKANSAAESSKPGTAASSTAASKAASSIASESKTSENNGLSTGAIIGIVGVVVVAGIVVAVIVAGKKKNNQ